jgi:hypothetical protein
MPHASGDTTPLIHQLTPNDWRDQSTHSAGKKDHKDLTITDIEKDKATLINKESSEQERAKAAAELYESGIKEFKFKDKDGAEHTYKLEEETKDGKKAIKVSDGPDTQFEVVQDENGNWVLVARPTGGGVAPGSNGGGSRQPTGGARGGGRDGGGHAGGGGGGGGGGGERVPRSRPSGMNYPGNDAGGVGHYNQPGGGSAYNPSGSYDHHVWQGIKNTDGSVAIKFNGCQVDTDGSGAHRHPEDATRQSQTSLRLSNGQSLDTDRDNFFVLPPSVAKAYGIHKGDLGWLVQEKTGKAVPIVFGDSGPEGKLGEASVHALNSLGYNVNGRSGVDKSEQFKVVFVPGSGDGTGDIASNSAAMAAKLGQTGKTGGATQVA